MLFKIKVAAQVYTVMCLYIYTSYIGTLKTCAKQNRLRQQVPLTFTIAGIKNTDLLAILMKDF